MAGTPSTSLRALAPAVLAAGALFGLLALAPAAAPAAAAPLVLYHRPLTAREALANPTRRAVLDAVRANPGATRTQVARALGIASTTVAHHVAVLACAGHLVLVRTPRGVECYLNGAAPPREVREPGLLAGPTVSVLMRGLRSAEGARLADLARLAGVSEKAVYWHLSRLERANLVRAEMEGRAKRYWLAAPTRGGE